MKALLVVALLAGVTGCKTIQEIRSDGPIETYSSVKPEQDLSQCILFAWQDDALAGSQVNYQPRPGGGTTVFTQSFVVFADVYPRDDKTKVEIFNVTRSKSFIVNRRIAGIKGCL
ncbi:hypothetical protein ACI2KC_21210 [Pseudomonas monteilii]